MSRRMSSERGSGRETGTRRFCRVISDSICLRVDASAWLRCMHACCGRSEPGYATYRGALVLRCARCMTSCTYDKLAPTRVCDLQTPSFVLIRCVVLVSGSTQAASSVSRVVKPGWTVSQTFFFGFSCVSGVASAGQRDPRATIVRRLGMQTRHAATSALCRRGGHTPGTRHDDSLSNFSPSK